MLLTIDNYKNGFLVDDEAIAGVTEMGGTTPSSPALYGAYVSHYLTGETLAYQEFERVGDALSFLNAQPRNWVFEAVGCSKKTANVATGCSACSTGGCGTVKSGCSS